MISAAWVSNCRWTEKELKNSDSGKDAKCECLGGDVTASAAAHLSHELRISYQQLPLEVVLQSKSTSGKKTIKQKGKK